MTTGRGPGRHRIRTYGDDSHRREHVNAINDAKKPETRARRITKALEMLS